MVSHQEIEAFCNDIIKYYKPEKIILFGSYAYGTPNNDSDVDLLVIKQTNKRRLERGKELTSLLPNKYNFPMDILIYNTEEVNKWENVPLAFITSIINKGKLMYKNE